MRRAGLKRCLHFNPLNLPRASHRLMAKPTTHPAISRSTAPTPVPKEAPTWVTEALVASTIRRWSPRYGHILSRQEAIEIIVNVGQMVNAVRAVGKI
jgi:hypothetical protein